MKPLAPLFGLVAALAVAVPAESQLRSQVHAGGFAVPLELVQDPAERGVQYLVQQRGRIRVLVNGVVQAQDFLNLTGQLSTGGEQGLLGLAFPPDYTSSGRFYVNFTNPAGHTVVARFYRSTDDPLRADPSSRFDLQWPSGDRFIAQPFENHNGGHLEFGPDGYLYIALGDGGGGGDPNNNAQNADSLLGKILRIDVDVVDQDAEGYDIPPDNPFVGGAALAEIWAFGLRNPWKFTFDRDGGGGPGTSAMVIGDVGQVLWEEIDYEPAGAGGRNYGWRLREGLEPYLPGTPPGPLPLTDPILVYPRIVGRSVTGGYVYRGMALGPGYVGRYFYADFANGRVWSVGLTVDPLSGEATAGTPVEHTAELGGTPTLGNISAFGVDLDGELYLVSFNGAVFRILPDSPAPPPPGVNLLVNGDFDAGAAGWIPFATPDSSFIFHNVVGGVLQFFRVPPPPGLTNEAVILQPTGVALPAGAPFVARVDLANTSTVRKRISLLLHDATFLDLTVCTFWLAPHAPMRTYEMRSHTTQGWSNATVSFYAATPGSDGGAYQVDNVSFEYSPGLPNTRTDCMDPTAPAPPGGAPSADLLVNGAFNNGLTGWSAFGQIVPRVVNGVFEFYRPPGVPSGVLIQPTGQAMAPGEIFAATVRLGNSSGVRKRVTVLLHDADFSDLMACTFWLSPGQQFSTYTVRGFATEAWVNATVSIYPATIDTLPWIRLDEVTFQRTPSGPIVGTSCVGM